MIVRTLGDLLKLLVALNTLTDRYAEHEIDRDEYLSKFDNIVKSYEAIE